MESDQLEKCLHGRHDLWPQEARLPTGPLRGLQGLCHRVTLGLQTVWGCSTLAPSCREPLLGKQGSGSPGAMRQGTGENKQTEEQKKHTLCRVARLQNDTKDGCSFALFGFFSLILFSFIETLKARSTQKFEILTLG